MEQVIVKILKLDESVILPVFSTDGAAGADVYSPVDDEIYANDIKVIKLKFKMVIPQGYEVQVRSRSGLAAKGITVANSPGTIDSDFRGECGVILHNNTNVRYFIKKGDRIAQFVLKEVTPTKFVECSLEEFNSEENKTERMDGGFGSTGK